jgi:hypothetical protein
MDGAADGRSRTWRQTDTAPSGRAAFKKDGR